jgi:alpha-glucosidase
VTQPRPAPWWRGGVIYQVYPRSFVDSDGDGVGDLPGLIERLEYLEWLGVDGVWLNPITRSPNKDWGYDVSDYCDVDPTLGTLDDVDRLIAAARERGIAVILDLVPNHTSDQHQWFLDARSSRDAEHRDWYVWADGRDGGPPNNWISVFGGRAWTYDEPTAQWYLHNFLPEQPDLDWWNEGVRAAFDEILRFWFRRGVAGFRLDVAHGIIKDRELRDNPPATAEDPLPVRERGQRQLYNFNRPEVHEVMQRWRRVADEFPFHPILVGETWTPNAAALARFYGSGEDELHLAFNFDFPLGPFEAGALSAIVAETQLELPPDALPAWTMSNHDLARAATRWCDGDERKVRCALLLVLGLRGTAFLYYGDELGMPQADISPEQRLDPAAGRDGARTPMPWRRGDGGGFTSPGVRPWLPVHTDVATVEEQRGDPDSVLELTRSLIRLRRESDDLRLGAYEPLASPFGVWAWQRGKQTLVAANVSDADADLDGVNGTIVLATARQRAGDRVSGSLRLGAWEGAIVAY